MDVLPGGAYDELVTAGLDALLRQPTVQAITDGLDPAESTEVLAAHLEKIVTRVLDSLPLERRLSVVNNVLARLIHETGKATADDLVADPPKMLYSVGPATYRPQNPLRRADLLINARGEPAHDREGVRYSEEERADVFTFTLSKSDRDYSPTTMYRDYAISPELIHWESQSTTSDTSPTGQRYIHHVEQRSRVLLFCRETNDGEFGAKPYFFLGPARYVTHTGSRPMAITWKLDYPMPADFFEAASVLAG